MARILLFTGKGGVGKTTVVAARALSAAERGYKIVVLSTDAARSLADSLDQPLGPKPRSAKLEEGHLRITFEEGLEP
jgi:arsenite-transporting ATPase